MTNNLYISRQAEKILATQLQSEKVVIVLGARQVGKTTLIKRLLPKDGVVYLNLDLEQDKNRLIQASKVSPSQAMLMLGSPQTILIDEAQRMSEVGLIIKGWYDFGMPVKFILSGSSSLDLLDSTAESLTGRNIKLFLPPLTFQEILNDQDWAYPGMSIEDAYKQFPEQVDIIIQRSLIYGFYPEVYKTFDIEGYLLNLTNDYILRDLNKVGLLRSIETLKRLLILLAHQVGSLVSTSELASTLGISRITVDRYIELLEQCFIIYKLSPYSNNLRSEIKKSHKIYFWDTGIRNAILNDFTTAENRGDIGHLWENWVINEYSKQNLLSGLKYNLYYWRTKNGSEVDLVIKKNQKLEAIECKWNSLKDTYSAAFFNNYQVKDKIIARTKPFVDIKAENFE